MNQDPTTPNLSSASNSETLAQTAPPSVSTGSYSTLINETNNQPFDPSAHKMIPVVEKPLDINQIPDDPVQQFNPFASSTMPATPKKSSHSKTNVILAILCAVFAVAAITFGVLWRQTVSELSSFVPNPPATDPEPIVPPDQISTLTCGLHSEPKTYGDGLLMEPVYVYRANYVNGKFTDITYSIKMILGNTEEANMYYPEIEQLVNDYQELFSTMSSQYDYDIQADELKMSTSQEDNILIFSIQSTAEHITNPFHSRIFALPSISPITENIPAPDFNNLTIDELRNYYAENFSDACEITTN